MKKILFAALLLASVMPAAAQETYENVKVAAEDLNGSARYVGMGGAMEALGAELSTMKSNPAGIGLFRRSNATVSFGAVIQGDAPSMSGADKTHMSFDTSTVTGTAIGTTTKPPTTPCSVSIPDTSESTTSTSAATSITASTWVSPSATTT